MSSLIKTENDPANENNVADAPASDSRMRYCPFRGPSVIIYHLMACDCQMGFPSASEAIKVAGGDGEG